MEEENKDLYQRGNFITAQVVIPADEFAREMLGENPQPRDLENFIKDHASLMEVVYGSAAIVSYLDSSPTRILKSIRQMVTYTNNAMHYVHSTILKAETEYAECRKPWYKRLFGR